jgi:preprotein translocase subunit SecA
MVTSLITKLIGTSNDRIIKKFYPIVEEINSKAKHYESLNNEDLANQTFLLKQRIKNGETLNDILVDAYATVREAASRVLNERHYDVQLLGGIAMHNGMIAEMCTGEGKTLTATLPVFLYALAEKGVHIVTVNDYLAQRDSGVMGKLYNFLNLSVGCIVGNMYDNDRKNAYSCDITYGTNNEFGFDYLRDNMKLSIQERVQKPFYFALVDEVDSILVDEARTPLIISGPSDDSSELYQSVDKMMQYIVDEDFEKDEKNRTVTLTETGSEHIENLLKEHELIKGENGSLYDLFNMTLLHHVNQALKAHKIFQKDIDYIVKDNKVIIIDEFTGRMMDGRRYSDGLHQALEAKEGAKIQNENQTLASISYQNYFLLYPKLCGMTGTAKTEEGEFESIYKLSVCVIPTNKPIARKDLDDEVYRTYLEKIDAICEVIKECKITRQPILLGSVSIEKSEYLSEHLTNRGIEHSVLNARHHANEAEIIAEAGAPGRITIATNMAGRGTDIKLGGNLQVRLQKALAEDPEADEAVLTKRIKAEIEENKKIVLEAGGLYVIGTERHESRRIDNQLKGRAGRQGDNGTSKFFLSLEDDLMRIFGSERLGALLQKMGLKPGEAIIHPIVSRSISRAQWKVEQRNFDIRKHLLKYDNVMSDQRHVIYEQRNEFLENSDLSYVIDDMFEVLIADLCNKFVPSNSYSEQWELHGLHEELMRLFAVNLDIYGWSSEEGVGSKEMNEKIKESVTRHFNEQKERLGSNLQNTYKSVLLKVIDQLWKDHLHCLDHLRMGINLRGYAQKDPLNEYKREAFQLFEGMISNFNETVISTISHTTGEIDFDEEHDESWDKLFENFNDERYDDEDDNKESKYSHLMTDEEASEMINAPRNSPCPCGSGYKYKHCHGNINLSS